jgi:hypothetical protein
MLRETGCPNLSCVIDQVRGRQCAEIIMTGIQGRINNVYLSFSPYHVPDHLKDRPITFGVVTSFSFWISLFIAAYFLWQIPDSNAWLWTLGISFILFVTSVVIFSTTWFDPDFWISYAAYVWMNKMFCHVELIVETVSSDPREESGVCIRFYRLLITMKTGLRITEIDADRLMTTDSNYVTLRLVKSIDRRVWWDEKCDRTLQYATLKCLYDQRDEIVYDYSDFFPFVARSEHAYTCATLTLTALLRSTDTSTKRKKQLYATLHKLLKDRATPFEIYSAMKTRGYLNKPRWARM